MVGPWVREEKEEEHNELFLPFFLLFSVPRREGRRPVRRLSACVGEEEGEKRIGSSASFLFPSLSLLHPFLFCGAMVPWAKREEREGEEETTTPSFLLFSPKKVKRREEEENKKKKGRREPKRPSKLVSWRKEERRGESSSLKGQACHFVKGEDTYEGGGSPSSPAPLISSSSTS